MTIAALVYTPHRDDAPTLNHPGISAPVKAPALAPALASVFACAFTHALIGMNEMVGQAAKFHRMGMPGCVSLHEEA